MEQGLSSQGISVRNGEEVMKDVASVAGGTMAVVKGRRQLADAREKENHERTEKLLGIKSKAFFFSQFELLPMLLMMFGQDQRQSRYLAEFLNESSDHVFLRSSHR